MDNRRLLLFFLIATTILLGWQWLMPAPAKKPGAPVATPTAAVAGAAAMPSAPGATPAPPSASAGGTGAAAAPSSTLAGPPVAATREEQLVLETEEFRAAFSNRGAQLVSFQVKEHRDEKGQPLELVRSRQGGPWPLGLVDADLRPLPLDDALFAGRRERDAEGRETLRFDYRGPAGNARKVIRVLGPGLLGLEVEASPPNWGLVLGPGVRNPITKELESKRHPRQVVYRAEGKVKTIQGASVEKLENLPLAGLSWAGVEDNYFISVLVPDSPLAAAIAQPVVVQPPTPGRPYRMTPFADEEALAPADAELPRDLRLVLRPRGSTLGGTLYVGAKKYERLAKLPWGLEDTLQWGIWGVLARPLLWALLWIHDHMVANYGWAIMLLTLGLRVILFPLTWSSQRSMQRMQELQPRMQAIRQKYRGKLRDAKGRMDLEAQRKMNEEMQELFRSEGANPYGGCLPILVQIPVFFALFTMLRSAVELRHAPWAMWIHDLSEPDPFYVLPIVMGASQVYQQRLTPMSGDPMQRRLMQLFPWIFTVFSLGFPAGLVLYWTVNNAVTIAQTMVLMKRKEAEKAAEKAERKSKRRRGGESGGDAS
ncbi:MAG TPA: membrane protein insertase YidC [Thermoanaerobaculia bacterium]|nr:membrane protein insertase YidC [Thermoanaerobaculia bacterium]